MGIGTPFYFFFYVFFFLEHFAHFHFRSHLQSLINGESHQIKLEQSQRCRPEAGWRRRLPSPATSRSLRPHRARPPSPLCNVYFAVVTKGEDPEALSPSTGNAPCAASAHLFRCLPAAEHFAARSYACAHVGGDRRRPRCQPR